MGTRYSKGDMVKAKHPSSGLPRHAGKVVAVRNKNSDSPDYVVKWPESTTTPEGFRETVKASMIEKSN